MRDDTAGPGPGPWHRLRWPTSQAEADLSECAPRGDAPQRPCPRRRALPYGAVRRIPPLIVVVPPFHRDRRSGGPDSKTVAGWRQSDSDLAPWTALVPPGARVIDATRRRARECAQEIAALEPESWVAVVDRRVLSRVRLRLLARRGELAIERELVKVGRGSARNVFVELVQSSPATPRSRRTLPTDVANAGVLASRSALSSALPLLWLASDRVLVAKRR